MRDGAARTAERGSSAPRPSRENDAEQGNAPVSASLGVQTNGRGDAEQEATRPSHPVGTANHGPPSTAALPKATEAEEPSEQPETASHTSQAVETDQPSEGRGNVGVQGTDNAFLQGKARASTSKKPEPVAPPAAGADATAAEAPSAALSSTPSATPSLAGGAAQAAAPPALEATATDSAAAEPEAPAPGTSDTELEELEKSIETSPDEEAAPGTDEQPPTEGATGESDEPPGTSETPQAGVITPEDSAAVAAGQESGPLDVGSEPIPDLGQAASQARANAEREAQEEEPAEESETPASDDRSEDQPEPASADPLNTADQEPAPEATEADVASAASEEVDAAVAEGGDADMADGGGGGGGGGGTGIEEQPAPSAPDVSGQPPEQGLAQAGSLPPAVLLSTLGSVSASAQREAGEARAELSANPPQRLRPSGAPATASRPASEQATLPPSGAPTDAPAAPTASDRPTPRPPEPRAPAAPPPEPRTPVIPEPAEGEQMGESGARAMQQAISRLPTRDPGLRIAPQPPPRVRLEGNAHPGTVDAQAADTASSLNLAASEEAAAAGEPMGEDELYPQVPPEILQAEATGAGSHATSGTTQQGGAPAAPPGEAGGAGSAIDDAASIVAHNEHRDEIRGAVQQGTGQIASARAQRAASEQQERQRAEQEMARLEQENAAQQSAERQRARAEIGGRRAQWRADQQQIVHTARSETNHVRRQAHQDVEQERQRGQDEADRAQEQGQQEAAEARRRGQEEAERERERANQESSGGGFFGWAASAARSFFDGIKRGIQAAFAAARAAVQAALQRAQELAHAAVERARQAAVSLVRAAGNVLTGIANVALAAFPRLREAAVGFIRNRVQAAEGAINALADRLKQGITAALNLLGRALNGILNVMERAYLAAVDFVAGAVQGIINRVKQAIEALGAFAALVKDIASAPGQWLRNLGAALMDGVRNHLWAALKDAVKQWFNDKVQQVVGLGQAVWNLLVRGGISLARIGEMVWEGIKAAIPPALIALLIEKLVSMLVPAASAVLLIVQGLQAAWGAARRILHAFERFFAFLRAVKTGNAGPQFAQAVAAAAVAVLDFLSNFLLARLARGARRVGQRLRAIAQRIGRRLRGVMRRAGRGLRRAGRRLAASGRSLRDRFRRRGRRRQRPNNTARQQERLRRAIRAVRRLEGTRAPFRLVLRVRLAAIRLRYRLSSLIARREPNGRYQVTARINPRLEAHIEDIGGRAARLGNYLRSQTQRLQSFSALQGAARQYVRRWPGYSVTLIGSGPSERTIKLHYRNGKEVLVGRVSKTTNEGDIPRKTGPKTDPNAPHNRRITEIIERHVAAGWEHIGGGVGTGLPERLVRMRRGANRPYRRMDASFRHPVTGRIKHVNVGLALKRRTGEHRVGDPIARERQAMEDFEKYRRRRHAKDTLEFEAYE